MRKYLAIARAALLEAIQEKSEIFIWVILEAVPVFVMGSLWLANQQHLVALNISQIITYYLVVMIISRLTEFYFDEGTGDLIRTGEFSKYLVKPIRFPFAFIPQALGQKVISGIVLPLAMLVPLVAVFGKHIIFPEPSRLLLFLLSLILTLGIRYTLSVMALAGAFFWERSEALTHARWMMEMVVGGYLLPLSMYPSWAGSISGLLPFKYIYYVPVSIFTGIIGLNTAVIELLKGIIWLAAMLLFSRWIWKKGIIRYCGVGG
jgi:ABC-2 type transport system permease protein